VLTGAAPDRAPGGLERQPMPVSGAGVPAGIDQIVAKLGAMGVHPGYALNLPASEAAVFTASVSPDKVKVERVVHPDRHTGEVLFDMGSADLGRAAEWGVRVHMGREFGLISQIAKIAARLAIIVMAAADVAMWWKRRPARSLGAPRVVAAVALLASVFLSLLKLGPGLTLPVARALDLAATAAVAPQRGVIRAARAPQPHAVSRARPIRAGPAGGVCRVSAQATRA